MKISNSLDTDQNSLPDGLINGFERRTIQGDGVDIDVLVGGSGPPLLLLHGYPQTRLCWKGVALELLTSYTLIIPDLRGYGRSGKPEAGKDHVNYTKRSMARDQVNIMHQLGFPKFYLAGHDRGGRVAYRLAIDYPEAVSKLGVLDIAPTVNIWDGVDSAKAMKMWNWFFLAQDNELAEHLISKDPEFFIRWTLDSQTLENFKFDPESLDDYIKCASNPLVVKGMCEDYRASWALDKDIDRNDYGRLKIACPIIVIWGNKGSLAGSDPLNIWNKWGNEVQGQEVSSGHFIPEEATAETVEIFSNFFK